MQIFGTNCLTPKTIKTEPKDFYMAPKNPKEEQDYLRLKEAVFKSDTEKFYTLTALMKRQILMNKMKITHQ